MKWVVKEGCAEGIVKPRFEGQKEPGRQKSQEKEMW